MDLWTVAEVKIQLSISDFGLYRDEAIPDGTQYNKGIDLKVIGVAWVTTLFKSCPGQTALFYVWVSAVDRCLEISLKGF